MIAVGDIHMVHNRARIFVTLLANLINDRVARPASVIVLLAFATLHNNARQGTGFLPALLE